MPNKPAAKDDPFRKIKTGSWTKWGGGRFGLIREDTDIWYCQSCREEQTNDLPGFLLPINIGEHVRVCAKCFNKARILKYSYHRVVQIIRVANHQ